MVSQGISASKSTLDRWINAQASPTIEGVLEIARFCGLTVGELVEGDVKPTTGMMPSGLFLIPRYDVQASAGNGALAISDAVSDRFMVTRDWLSRYVHPNDRVGLIEARGDSMEPTIQDGDTLLINFNFGGRDAILHGGVFVITLEGALLVKRLQITMGGELLIISDNPAYETERLPRATAEERLIVHARVVWTGGPIRRR